MFKLPNFFLAIKEWFNSQKNELQEYVDFLQDTVSENWLRIAWLNNELAEKDKIICAKVRIIEDLNMALKIKESAVITECARHKKDKLELYRKLGHAQDEIICLKHEFQLLKDKAGKSDGFAQIIGTVKKLGL